MSVEIEIIIIFLKNQMEILELIKYNNWLKNSLEELNSRFELGEKRHKLNTLIEFMQF